MLFSYCLSLAIAFIFFGTIFNILKSFEVLIVDKDDEPFAWLLVFLASLLWFIFVPCLVVLIIVLSLKKLTEKISLIILKKVKK